MRAVLVILVVLAALAGCSDDAARVTGQPEGDRKEAPEFSLPGLEGGTVRLADFRGEPLLINFWASWCEPCKEEMPEVNRFARTHGDIRVLGIAVNDDPDDSRAFARSVGVRFPLAVDRDATTGARYGVTGLPVTVLVGADGRIVSTVYGGVDRDDLDALAALVAG